MKKLSIAAIILASLAIAGEAFIFATQKEDSEELHARVIKSGYHIYAPSIPDTLYFCGERVPLNLYYVREGLDRELVSNMYYQSNTLFYIKRATRYFPTIERILKERNGVVVLSGREIFHALRVPCRRAVAGRSAPDEQRRDKRQQ